MNRHRCRECNHPVGVRVLSFIRDPKLRSEGQPRRHKKPCACLCHLGGIAPGGPMTDQEFLDSL